MDRGMLLLLFPEDQDPLLCFVEVIFLAPHFQDPYLLLVVYLVIDGSQGYYCRLQTDELEACKATQSWVNREYRRGLSTHPCGAPVLSISKVEVFFPTFTTWGRPVRKSRTEVNRVGFRPMAASLMMDMEDTMVLNTEL
jgi:hypothetical protein